MTRPTNIQVGTAPLTMDTEEAVRKMCEAQGCTCGDRLKVVAETMTQEAAADLVAAGMPDGEKHSAVEVIHGDECPMLAAMRTN